MPDQDDGLTEEARQLYRKTRTPHKFCPFCGTRNEADADRCAECDKDISWMRVPEPVPYDTAPPERPKSLPEQQKIFTPRAIVIFTIIILLIIAMIVVLVLVTRKSEKPKTMVETVTAKRVSPAAGQATQSRTRVGGPPHTASPT